MSPRKAARKGKAAKPKRKAAAKRYTVPEVLAVIDSADIELADALAPRAVHGAVQQSVGIIRERIGAMDKV